MRTLMAYTHLLKISNTSALNQFLHDCVNDLVYKSGVDYENYCNGDIEWTEEDFNKARAYIQNLFNQSVIEDSLELPKDLTDDVKDALESCYRIRKNDIFQILARDYILDSGHNLVENIDWKLKWILGSSDLATLQEPKLQVDLHCTRKNKSSEIKNTINFEANLDQIDTLISELSRFQKELK